MLSAPFKPPRFISTKPEPPNEVQPIVVDKVPVKIPCEPKLDSKTSKYVVQYRKRTNKKHKTWEGDGELTVTSTQMIFHFDSKSIAKPLSSLDGILKFGAYEVEVDCEIEVTETNEIIYQKNIVPLTNSKIPKKTLGPSKRSHTIEITEKLEPSLKLFKSDPSSFILSSGPSPVIVDAHLTNILRPHQRDGVQFLYNRIIDKSGALLADEMGLGKTLMTITVIWTLLKQSPDPLQKLYLNKILIVCPVTLMSNWRREFKKWLDMNKLGILVIDKDTVNYRQDLVNFAKTRVYQVLIMSYEKILNCEDLLENIKFDLVVCDEGHKLKNNQSMTLKVLKRLDIDCKILISGTPIQNNLNEFFTLMDFLNPGALGTLSLFQRKFIKPIEYSRDVNCVDAEILAQGLEASQELMQLTAKFILRRTSEVLSKYLGPKTDILVFVKPTPVQLQLFKQILAKVVYSTNNALSLINTFKKVCNSPKLLENDTIYDSTGLDIPLTIQSGKINLVTAMLIKIYQKREKVVLVSNYTKTLDIFSTICSQLNYSFLRLDGTTNSSTRSTLINQFNNSPFPQFPIFLLSSKLGGFGINLVGASRLILFDNDWNPASDLQSMSRIYRDGQTKPVYIYRLFTSGCMDEKILQRQLMKVNLSDWFLDVGEVNSNVFDIQDLKNLFTINDDDCNTHNLLDCSCDSDANELPSLPEPQNLPEPIVSSQYSSGWMSALDFRESKNSISSALSDYTHFPIANIGGFEHDDIIKLLIHHKDFQIGFVFSKYDNPTNDIMI